MNIDDKTLNKILVHKYSNTSKRLYTTIKWDFFWECEVGTTFSINEYDTSHKQNKG